MSGLNFVTSKADNVDDAPLALTVIKPSGEDLPNVASSATNTNDEFHLDGPPYINYHPRIVGVPNVPSEIEDTPGVASSSPVGHEEGVAKTQKRALQKHWRSISHVGVTSSGESYDSEDFSPSKSGVSGMQPSPKGHHRSQSQGQPSTFKRHRRVRSSSKRTHTREASRTESVYTIRERKKSWLDKISFWRREEKTESSTRLVVPNPSVPEDCCSKNHPNHSYPGNEIRTTKYTILSFVPKTLFEQFHRFANLYFLFIVFLNFVPLVNAFAKELSIIPLVLVLCVTAIKDIFEDRRRYRSDKRVNARSCKVYSSCSRCYVSRIWKDIRVGDILYLSCDEVIPADVVVLNSSDDQGICYIESSNLDGETTLKQRQSVQLGVLSQGGKFDASFCNFVLEIGPPTTKMNHFVGSIPVQNGDSIPLSNDNLIPRDCAIKNTEYVEGLVVYAGWETKALLNNGGTRYKRSKLERQMNSQVIWCVAILFVICLFSATGAGIWQSKVLAENSTNTVIYFLPQSSFADTDSVDYVEMNSMWIGFTSFWTFIILYQVLIPISLYVTIEVIKLIQVYHIHLDKDFEDKESGTNIVCRALNITEELGQIQYVFTDKTGTLTENRMIFQRCSISGIDYAHELVYETLDGKVTETFLTNSQLERNVQHLESMFSSADIKKSGFSLRAEDYQRVWDFFFILALCNTVVVAKPKVFDKMKSSFADCLQNPALKIVDASVSSSRESYAATDITVLPDKNWINGQLPSSFSCRNNGDISACHSDQSSAVSSCSCKLRIATKSSSMSGKPKYEAESPDELALVEAAFKYGFKLVMRSLHAAAMEIPGLGITEFEILHVLPFDSNRKRMSVVVRDKETGQKILYCKGADSAILENLSPNMGESTVNVVEETKNQLNVYSKKGLRVLCLAKKIIPDEEYISWNILHKAAENSLAKREENLNQSFCRIEREMQLIGATGIEDKLQEGVPKTINSLKQAGIVVWVLTGDKQETAINIAYASSLFSSNMEILKLNARTREQTERTIRSFLQQIEEEENSNLAKNENGKVEDLREKTRGLVVDGFTLVFILDKRTCLIDVFFSLASHCSAVMCCRATPLQKAMIVRKVKAKLKVLTLAVGDGANDVSMIQTADVGIGISGVEGRQAVMASDFAIRRFRHLEKLVLVHGHWCYDRLSKIILFFFYKNAFFVFLLTLYQIINGFSGSVLIDDLYFVNFNLLFTSFPPLSVGAYDQDAPANLLLSKPKLYSKTRLGEAYSPLSFWLSILEAAYHSSVLFFVLTFVYRPESSVYEFGMAAMHVCIFTLLVRISLEISSWTIIQVASILVSYLIFFLFGIFYTVICNGCTGLPSQTGELVHMLTSPKHWICLLLISTIASLPRIVFSSLKATVRPDAVTEAVNLSKPGRRWSSFFKSLLALCF